MPDEFNGEFYPTLKRRNHVNCTQSPSRKMKQKDIPGSFCQINDNLIPKPCKGITRKENHTNISQE